jgi:PAS domain S-box-containing protein
MGVRGGGVYEVEFDMGGYFIKADPAVLNLLGYTWDELSQMSVMQVVPEEDLEMLMQAFAEFPNVPANQNFTIHARTKHGSRVKVKTQILPVIEGGEVVRVKARFMLL